MLQQHFSLTEHILVDVPSVPCSSLTSCCPNIVSSLVYKYTMIHYSMAHEPVGIVGSFLQDIRAVSFSREWPCQFYMIQHTFKCSFYCAVMDCWFFLEGAVSILDLSVLVLAGNFLLKCHSGNFSFHDLLGHDLLLLVVYPRSFPLASIVQRYFMPLIGSLQ